MNSSFKLITKIQINTNMADSHFLKKYIFIDFFFPFLTKQLKKPSSLLLMLRWPILMRWPVELCISLHTTEQYHCLVPFL